MGQRNNYNNEMKMRYNRNFFHGEEERNFPNQNVKNTLNIHNSINMKNLPNNLNNFNSKNQIAKSIINNF